MIISKGYQVVVATPPKTGTEFLIESLCRGDKPWGSYTLVNNRHTMEVPHWASGYQAYFPHRDPYDRLVSWYFYLRHNRTKLGGEEAAKGWPMFVDYWMKTWRSGQDLVHKNNYSTSLKRLEESLATRFNVTLMSVRQLDNFVRGIRMGCKSHTVNVSEHKNASPRLGYDEFEFWTDDIVHKVRDWALPDCEKFNYPERPSCLAKLIQSKERSLGT